MYDQIRTKFLLVIILCFLVLLCKEEPNPADAPRDLSSVRPFSGLWVLEEGSTKHILEFFPQNSEVRMDGEQILVLDRDSLGVRIRRADEETVLGYFLYEDIKKKTWIGTWDNRTVRLFRQTLPKE